MPKRNFEAVNGLRDLAAILVVMLHASAWFGALAPAKGFLSVDLFFLMSGFVIAYSYEPRLARGLTAKDFLLIRLIRLYPLYLLGFVLAAAAFALTAVIRSGPGRGAGLLLPSFFCQIFMLPSPTFHARIPSRVFYSVPLGALLYRCMDRIGKFTPRLSGLVVMLGLPLLLIGPRD